LVSIELYNLSGQLIESTSAGILPAGDNNLTKGIDKLASGIYMVVIATPGEKHITKLQVRK
jgi:hypothetical protein